MTFPKRFTSFSLFLRKVKKDFFSVLPGHPKKFNLNREEYLTMRSLQNDKSVIIKRADKDSAVVVWDRQDYLKEAKRQLSDSSIYKEVKVTEKDVVDLVDKSNKTFVDLEGKTLFRRRSKTILNLISKKLPMLENFTYYLRFIKFKQSTRMPGNFKLCDVYRKKFGILDSPFTGTRETR